MRLRVEQSDGTARIVKLPGDPRLREDRHAPAFVQQRQGVPHTPGIRRAGAQAAPQGARAEGVRPGDGVDDPWHEMQQQEASRLSRSLAARITGPVDGMHSSPSAVTRANGFRSQGTMYPALKR